MTNELEKQFFDTFGIEARQFIKDFPTREKAAAFGRKITGIPKYNKDKFEIGSYTNNIDIFQVHWKEYPQISDRIYLMLLATLTCISSIEFPFSDIQKLKEDILKEAIKHQYGFDKHQVRTLFEER